jgi:hypothetical protein
MIIHLRKACWLLYVLTALTLKELRIFPHAVSLCVVYSCNKEQKLVGLWDGNAVCFLWGADWIFKNCSKTSRFRTNWEQILVQISESQNYTSATENMLRKVIKWTSHVFSGNATLLLNLDCISQKKLLMTVLDLECFELKSLLKWPWCLMWGLHVSDSQPKSLDSIFIIRWGPGLPCRISLNTQDHAGVCWISLLFFQELWTWLSYFFKRFS